MCVPPPTPFTSKGTKQVHMQTLYISMCTDRQTQITFKKDDQLGSQDIN